MKSLSCTVLCITVLLCPALHAAETSIEVTVDAGDCDRENTPVVAVVEVPADAVSATLVDPDGKKIPGQLTGLGVAMSLKKPSPNLRELHFILPKLAKGKKMTLKVETSKKPPAPPVFHWKDTPGEHVDLLWGDRPVLRYMYHEYDDSDKDKRHDTFKVYHHVFSPSGERIITKGPGGKYTHHRGLFFGYCHCTFPGGKADTWGCGSGHQVHGEFLSDEGGPVLGRHRVAIQWRANKENKTFVKEQRELTAYNTPGGNLIEFATRVSSAGGPVKLDGNAPHAGFQFRAEQEVAEKTEKQTQYLRPDGRGEKGQARAKAVNLPWDAISFILGDKRYTALYLDSPKNPKPAEYNERTYGRFGSYFVTELDDEKSTTANYRVWIQDGEMTVEQARVLSNDFVNPVKVEVKYK